MRPQLPLFGLIALLASACTNTATGQQEPATLHSRVDSVSYAIGADIGRNIKANMHQSGMDSLDLQILTAGFRDGLDSVERIPEEQVKTMIQAYVMEMQQAQMAKRAEEGQANAAAGKAFLEENGKKEGVMTTASGLQYTVEQMGTGTKPIKDDTVKINYRGTLLNGREFDSSYKNGEPLVYPVARFIPGWVEALQLMPTGSKFKLFIPSELAYGDGGMGEEIPPNSTLVFDLELIGIEHPGK